MLGPMLGFVYAGTSLLTLAYVWVCVGETTGRSNAEIEEVFLERVPVRKWETYSITIGHDGALDKEKGGVRRQKRSRSRSR
jgi:hypothetical protein